MSDLEKKWSELGDRFIACLKFKLKQDGVEEMPSGIVNKFGVWLANRTSRVKRYEAEDMRLVDEFLDAAWACVQNPNLPLPVEGPEPPAPATPAPNRLARAAAAINWQEVAHQQVEVVFDPNVQGNWREVNR